MIHIAKHGSDRWPQKSFSAIYVSRQYRPYLNKHQHTDMTDSDKSSSILAQLHKDPEKGYDAFVKLCNHLSTVSQEVIDVASFLSSVTNSQSVAVRRALLKMSADDDPSWLVFLKARLKCDLNHPTLLNEISQEKGARLVIEDQKKSPPCSQTNKCAQVCDFLLDIFSATARTLTSDERPPRTNKIMFKQRSVLRFFGLPPNCCSIIIARSALRKIPFYDRKSKVRELISMCIAHDKWEVTTAFITSMNHTNQEHNDEDSLSIKIGGKRKQSQVYTSRKHPPIVQKTTCPSMLTILRSYILADEKFVRILLSLRSSTGTNHPFSLYLLRDDLHENSVEFQTNQDEQDEEKTGIRVLRLPRTDCHPIILSINSFLDDDFRGHFLTMMNSALFMRGVSGRNESFIRIVSLNDSDNTFFQIGKNLYPCLDAMDHERKLLTLLNTLISVQNRIYNDPLIPDHQLSCQLLRGQVNSLQIVVEYNTRNSGYGLHSDFGSLLNDKRDLSLIEPSELEISNRLPRREEMQTFTLVLNTCSDTKTDTHKLSFYDDRGKCVGSIPTNGNMLHAQLHGSQLFQHKVEILSSRPSEQMSLRIVVSARYTVPSSPQMLHDLFGPDFSNQIVDKTSYSLESVIEELTQGRSPHLCVASPFVTLGDQTLDLNTLAECAEKWKLSSKQLKDVWAQANIETMSALNLHRASVTLKCQDVPPWKFFSGAHVVRRMVMLFGLIPTIEFNHNKKRDEQSYKKLSTLFTRSHSANGTISEVFLPLDVLLTSSLLSSSILSHTSRSHPPCPGDHQETNFIILSRAYKNDARSISTYVDTILSFMFPERRRQFRHTTTSRHDSNIPSIVMFGSGGAPRNTDAYACDMSTVHKSQASATVPSPQSLETNPQNKTLSQLCDRRGTVAVFISLDEFLHFLPDDTLPRLGISKSQNASMFLGYFYLAACERTYLTPNQLNELNNELSPELERLEPGQKEKFIEYSQFRLEYHFAFPLTPLFPTWKEYKKLFLRNNSGGFVHWIVRASDSQSISANVVERISSRDTYPNEAFIENYLATKSGEFETIYDNHMQMNEFNNIAGDDAHNDNDLIRGTVIRERIDILHHLVMVMVSGSLRYSKNNVISHEGGEVIGPLPLSDKYKLSTVYRAHPMPMPIRSYDVIPLLLRSCAIDHGLLQIEGQRTTSAELTSSFLFMAILNRLTGRPQVFLLFRQHFPEMMSAVIPGPKELPSFLAFVKANDCHKTLFNPQHANSIPIDVRAHQHVFCAVMESMAAISQQLLRDMQKECTTRTQAVRMLGINLHKVVEQHKTHFYERHAAEDKCMWLSHQIIADLEEIFIEPFGAVLPESVMYGNGAKQGWFVCFGVKHAVSARGEENAANRSGELLTWIKDQLTKSNRESHLYKKMMCLRWDDCEKQPTISINGRPLCETDIEHFLCKIYVGASKTISSRSTSKMPLSSKAGHHPIKLNGDTRIPWDDDCIKTIMCECVKAYGDALHEGVINRTPDCFLLPGEMDPILCADNRQSL